MINFIKYRKIYYLFSGILILASIFSLFFFGLKLGIDFRGGSILEIEFKKDMPSSQKIQEELAELDLGSIYLQTTGERGLILRMKDIDEETHQELIERLRKEGEFEEKRFEAIGPAIGQELQQKTKILIALSLLIIVSYIAISFRKISRPIHSLQYGLVTALVALFHDVLITLGVFSFLGKFLEVEITVPIVVGLLTVFGYSINDTIVVFDRIRENLLKKVAINYGETVNVSLNQTLLRSLNTSLTTLFVLISLFFLGGETLKYFALVLILGVALGAYSSIFIASQVMVSLFNLKRRRLDFISKYAIRK